MGIEHRLTFFAGLSASGQIPETGLGLLINVETRIAGSKTKRPDVDRSRDQHIRRDLITNLAWEAKQGTFLDDHGNLWRSVVRSW